MSYFRILPRHLFKNLTKSKIKTIQEQYREINNLYQTFLQFYDEKYKFFIEYGFKNKSEFYKFKSLDHLKKNFQVVLKILRDLLHKKLELINTFRLAKLLVLKEIFIT